MSTTEAHIEKLGEDGERCAACSAPLAEDQRYCLNCGERRGNARLPFLDVLREQWESERAGAKAPTPPPPRSGTGASGSDRNWTPLVAAAGGGIAALVLGVGFLIGQSGDAPRPAARPQVVQVGGGGTAPAAAFQEDWPQGQDGWTVQLQALPKASTQPAQVASAKTAAQSKGAADVGALDSDQHGGLDPGSYVVYSGVLKDEKAAKKALDKLKGSFPDAKVIEVSGAGGAVSDAGGDKNALAGGKDSANVDKSQLQKLQGLSPQEYAKQSRKLPDQTILPGKAPPTDNAAPGGGSDAEVIK
jgi:hypothetical protein